MFPVIAVRTTHPARLGRLDEVLALYKMKEAICVELGNKGGLGFCYWNWGLLAREQGDRITEIEKLQKALIIFTELKMARQRDSVQAELDNIERIAS